MHFCNPKEVFIINAIYAILPMSMPLDSLAWFCKKIYEKFNATGPLGPQSTSA